MNKIEAINMYETDKGFKIYSESVNNIGLWQSEEIIIKQYANTSSKILDLGCGCGRTTFGLYDLGFHKIVGLDLCSRSIKYATKLAYKQNKKIDFIVGDSSELFFDAEEFDLVFYSFNGLQLIPGYENRMNVIKESERVLKDGGYFIFTAHDRNNPEFKKFWEEELLRWEKGINNKELEIYGDMIIKENDGIGFIHYSNIEEIEKMIKETNFNVVDIKKRSDIAIETKDVLDWSSDTNFWILRKELKK